MQVCVSLFILVENFISYELSASQLEVKVTLSPGKQHKMSYCKTLMKGTIDNNL